MIEIHEILAEVIILLIEIIALIVGGLLVRYFITRIAGEKLKQNYTWAKIVANSVEQTTRRGMRSVSKKEEARQILKKLINDKSNGAQIDTLLESAVYEMHQQNKEDSNNNRDKI